MNVEIQTQHFGRVSYDDESILKIQGIAELREQYEDLKRTNEKIRKEADDIIGDARELKNRQDHNQPLEVKVSNTEVAKGMLGTIGNAMKTISKVLTSPAVIPTTMRRIYDSSGKDRGEAKAAGILAAIGGGVGSLIITTINEDPLAPYAATFAATNIASGIYEFARHHKNKLREEKKERLLSGEVPKDILFEEGTSSRDYNRDVVKWKVSKSISYDLNRIFPRKDLLLKRYGLSHSIDLVEKPRGFWREKRDVASIYTQRLEDGDNITITIKDRNYADSVIQAVETTKERYAPMQIEFNVKKEFK